MSTTTDPAPIPPASHAATRAVVHRIDARPCGLPHDDRTLLPTSKWSEIRQHMADLESAFTELHKAWEERGRIANEAGLQLTAAEDARDEAVAMAARAANAARDAKLRAKSAEDDLGYQRDANEELRAGLTAALVKLGQPKCAQCLGEPIYEDVEGYSSDPSCMSPPVVGSAEVECDHCGGLGLEWVK